MIYGKRKETKSDIRDRPGKEYRYLNGQGVQIKEI